MTKAHRATVSMMAKGCIVASEVFLIVFIKKKKLFYRSSSALHPVGPLGHLLCRGPSQCPIIVSAGLEPTSLSLQCGHVTAVLC